MELKEIITDETLLCTRADEVDTKKGMKEAREIIAQLKNVIRKKELTSLSAPAIGYAKRIFCINFSDNEIKTFINPVIMQADPALVLSEEKSYCLPGRRFLVPRNNKVMVMYTTPTGKIESREINGAASAVFQQEIHMLDNILLSDIGLEIDEMWDNATQEEREEVIGMYLDSLDLKEKELDRLIQEDPEAKQVVDAIDFMTKAEKGEIEFEEYQAPPKEDNTETENGSGNKDTD